MFELLLGATACGPICNCDTDIVTFVEEFENEISSVLIGQWPEHVGERMWSIAEECIDSYRKQRPTSTQVSLIIIIIILLLLCITGS